MSIPVSRRKPLENQGGKDPEKKQCPFLDFDYSDHFYSLVTDSSQQTIFGDWSHESSHESSVLWEHTPAAAVPYLGLGAEISLVG